MTLPSDPRPAPQYGEYATPEEVAAITGVPVGSSAPPAPTAPVVAASPKPAGAPVAGARRFDRPVTFALLIFGLLSLIQYAPLLVDYENFLETATANTVYASIDFGDAARVGGYVLLGVYVLLLIGAVVGSYAAARKPIVSFWIPLTAGALGGVAFFVTLVVILAQTPGALTQFT